MQPSHNPDEPQAKKGNGNGGNGNGHPPPPPPPPTPNPIPPGKYQVFLAYAICDRTRASDDTLYIAAAAQSDVRVSSNLPALWQNTSIEEVEDHAGTLDLNLDVGIFSVPSGTELRVCHIILNYGAHGAGDSIGLRIVKDEAVGKLDTRAFDRPLNLQQVGSELQNALGDFNSCDGAVAARNFRCTGDQLEQATQWGPPYSSIAILQSDEPGYDSNWGCGDNSHYLVTWYISRTQNPPTP